MNAQTISRIELTEIIMARYEEILGLVRDELVKTVLSRAYIMG